MSRNLLMNGKRGKRVPRLVPAAWWRRIIGIFVFGARLPPLGLEAVPPVDGVDGMAGDPGRAYTIESRRSRRAEEGCRRRPARPRSAVQGQREVLYRRTR